METFSNLFNIILTGDKESSRKAARQVGKFLHSFYGQEQFDEIRPIIEKAPEEYAKITEDFRQVNFVIAISVIYFLHNRESQPDFLFPWLFSLLWHRNGNIRYAVVRMVENELGPLTYHIRFPDEARTVPSISPAKADQILLELFFVLNTLLRESWKPEYKKYKYIDSLPSGTYKSIQLILSELEEDCGKEYIKQMEKTLHII